MLSFLFWNLNLPEEPAFNSNIENRLARIVAAENVDIIALAEARLPPERIQSALPKTAGHSFRHVESASERLRVLTRLPVHALVPRYDSSDGRLVIMGVKHKKWELLFAVVHLQSKQHWSERDQAAQATIQAREIVRQEEAAGHARTMVIGDFNMNPFESGMVDATGFHAVMSRRVASSDQRKVAGSDYRFFYNPMWGLFGDRTAGPPGTFYYSASRPGEYFWHMFDQVLVRPELIDSLGEVRILASDGTETLLTESGHPDKAAGSDHLPILCRLKALRKQVKK